LPSQDLESISGDDESSMKESGGGSISSTSKDDLKRARELYAELQQVSFISH